MHIVYRTTGPRAEGVLRDGQDGEIRSALGALEGAVEGALFVTSIIFSDRNFTLTFARCGADGVVVSSRKKRFTDVPFSVPAVLGFASDCLAEA